MQLDAECRVDAPPQRAQAAKGEDAIGAVAKLAALIAGLVALVSG